MPRTRHDQMLVATASYSELKVICVRYGIPVKKLREIIKEIGHDGKNEHSRKKIYRELENRGYEVIPKQKKMFLPDDTLAPSMPPSEIYVTE